MLVDTHTHVWEYPGHLSEEFVREGGGLSRSGGVKIHVDLNKHIKDMHDVDKAIVVGFKSEMLEIDVPNDYVADYVSQYPDKLIGYCSVDPNNENAVEELERSIKELNLKGLKLAPIYQNFDPNGEKGDAIFKKANELNIPILLHQGTTFPRKAPLKYAKPILLEDVALKYPDLKMVIAHMGHPWEADTIALIRKQPNVYADISALYYRPWQFYNTMVLSLEYGVTHKLLFGTDYPFTTAKESIENIYNMNSLVEGTNLPKIPKSVLSDIIFKDSLELLGLNN